MNVVGYVRLSRDEDKENYLSIITQQDIINDYAASNNLIVNKIYIDDNYSGYTFNRPAFSEMMEELNEGNIDVILAKDLSRIGRNNGQVLVLIDKFKEMNKRLILINEGNGGFDVLEDSSDILGIKTWYNEMYVKDISRKIRANMSSKQKKGELIMGNYYGYKKLHINDKFKLVVDEDIKPVIELIFNSYVNGLGYKKICDLLNEKGYPTPSQYIKRKFEQNGRVLKSKVSSIWQTHMVRRILQDDVYIGVLRTKKRESKHIKGKQENVPRSEQYVFENHHEPIISKELFHLAQSINTKKQTINHRGNAKYNYIFSGLVVCGDCGYSAGGKNLKKHPKVERGYDCLMYQKYGLKHCSSHAVSEEILLLYLKELLADIRTQYYDYMQNLNLKKKKSNIKSKLDKLNKELQEAKDELKLLLNQKLKDIIKESNIEYKKIIEDNYAELENDKKQQISQKTKEIEELKKINIQKLEATIKTAIDVFDGIINSDVPSRKMLEMIIDKIIINKDRTVEFKLLVNIDELAFDNISMT